MWTRLARFLAVLPPGLAAMMRGGTSKGLLNDGDMEAAGTALWTPAGAAVLTKQGGAAKGAQCLRIAYNGTANPRCNNTFMMTGGYVYTLKGWGRGDGGSGLPKIYDSGVVQLWPGTTSSSWQRIDITFTAGGAGNRTLQLWNAAAVAGYVEFDDLILTRVG